jgi:hypothetical protein
MCIHFAFSDECGDYLSSRSAGFRRAHPYYVRATFLMDGEDYKKLSRKFKRLRETLSLPHGEIKWSYIYSLKKHQNRDENIPQTKDYYFLREIPYATLVRFIKESIGLLGALTPKIILTITPNDTSFSFSIAHLYEMHIRSILQRLQYEVQGSPGLVVLFFDPVGEEKSNLLRETYRKIYNVGDFVDEYTHIKDSLNLEMSHHSVGIQIADYIAGCTVGFLRGYSDSTMIFRDEVHPHLRVYRNKILGVGMVEVPTERLIRAELRRKLEALTEPETVASID